MKFFVLILLTAITFFACKKQSDIVYDSHLFSLVQAHNWVFDSAQITDSAKQKSSTYAVDTVQQVIQFNSQQYILWHLQNGVILDSTLYQLTYNNPKRIYYYGVGEQVIVNQYLDIDTVNASSLVVTGMDTLQNTSRSFFHAQ